MKKLMLSKMVIVLMSMIGLRAYADCAWSNYQYSPAVNGAVETSDCLINGNGTSVAKRSITLKYFGTADCSVTWVKTGYQQTSGVCVDASFGSTSIQCGVNAGRSYGIVTVGQMPFPTANVVSFCGDCGYEVRYVGSSPTGGVRLEPVCKQ